MKRCGKCVVSEDLPFVTFDEKGVCSICSDYKGKKEAGRLKSLYKAKFTDLIKRVSGRGGYDLLMCFSGGKDSSYAMSVLKRKYKLKILAFTFDNGFIPKRTLANIRNVVESLDVDHIFFKPRANGMRKIFRDSVSGSLYPAKSLQRASAICISCMGLIKYLSLKTAIEKEIPLIGYGWTPGQAPITSSILEINPKMIKSMERVIRGPISAICGCDADMYFLNKRHYSKPEKFPVFVHPPAFLEYNEDKMLRNIKALGWKKPAGLDANTTNCSLDPMATRLHVGRYKFHPYELEMAGLVREGYISRKEGIKRLDLTKGKKTIKKAKKKLGL